MSERYIEKSQTTETPSGMSKLQMEGYSQSMTNQNKVDAPSLPNLELENEKMEGLQGKDSQEGVKNSSDSSSRDNKGGGEFKGPGKGRGAEK